MSMKVENTVATNGSARYWTQPEKKLWLTGLFSGCLVVYMARAAMPLCIVSISNEFEWSKTDSGTVLSSFFWGYCMTQILGGYFSDRIGGDTVIVVAAVGWTLLTFWTPQLLYLSSDKTTVLSILTLSRVLMGCLQGVHYPSTTSLIAQKVAESEKSLSYGIATAGGQMGTLATGFLGSHLLETFGWQVTFYVIGMLGMAWVLTMRYYLIAKQRKKATILSLKEDLSPQHNAPTQHSAVPWLTLFSKAPFWAVIVTHFCQNWCFFVLLSWLPTYFHETFPEAKGWVFNVVPWLVCIPTVLFGGWLADFLISKGYSVTTARKLLETLCLLGYATFLFALSFTTTYHGALFCMTLAVASSGFHNSGVLLNPTDIAPNYAGSVFGVMNTAGAIPGFVGVYIAGHILEVTKSWTTVFNQTAVICIVGWIVFMLFGTGKKIV